MVWTAEFGTMHIKIAAVEGSALRPTFWAFGPTKVKPSWTRAKARIENDICLLRGLLSGFYFLIRLRGGSTNDKIVSIGHPSVFWYPMQRVGTHERTQPCKDYLCSLLMQGDNTRSDGERNVLSAHAGNEPWQ